MRLCGASLTIIFHREQTDFIPNYKLKVGNKLKNEGKEKSFDMWFKEVHLPSNDMIILRPYEQDRRKTTDYVVTIVNTAEHVTY